MTGPSGPNLKRPLGSSAATSDPSLTPPALANIFRASASTCSGLLFSPANPLVLGPIDGHRMALLMRDTVRSFLDVHILGSPADTFTATVARYSELAAVK
jgi:hypothetical protein